MYFKYIQGSIGTTHILPVKVEKHSHRNIICSIISIKGLFTETIWGNTDYSTENVSPLPMGKFFHFGEKSDYT